MKIVERAWRWAGLQWYKYAESLRVGKWRWNRPKRGEWGYVDPKGIDSEQEKKEGER